AMYFPYQVQSCQPPPVNSGAIDLLPSTVEVDEFGVSVTLHLIRTNGSDGQATVVLEPQDISATLGEDYVLDTNLVTFGDGETEKSVEIFILDDANAEGDEQFQVQISEVTGAEMGESTSATCVIIDDDQGSGQS
ncbi:MAG: Calx-beta domain-containing protein, partial [Desulfosarcinaceae bacterium]